MIISLLLALGLSGSGDQNPPEVRQTEAPVTFSTRVNLVNVPVVVRDKKGRAVGNLTKENFQLFDRGKLQVISKFSVEKAGARAATMVAHLDDDAPAGSETTTPGKGAIPTRYVAYLFDDQHLDPGDLTQVRAAALRHLDKLAPTDRAAIVTASGRSMLDFTDDHEAIRAELNKITPLPPINLGGCPPFSADDYYAYVMKIGAGPSASEAMTCGGLKSPSGLASNLPAVMVDAAIDKIRIVDTDRTGMELTVLDRLVRRMTMMPGERVIVLASPGFIFADADHGIDFSTQKSAIIDHAIQARVVINTLNARGLFTTQNKGAEVASWALAEIADDTGGTFFHNSNDFDEGFRVLAAAPEYEYILGFSPQNLKLDGAFHALKVVVNGNSLTATARHGYYAPKREADEAAQALAEIREALFSRDELLEIPCEVQTQFFKAAPDVTKLSVLAKIDLHGLHFKKTDGRNLNTVTFVTGIFDRNGNLIKGITKTVDLHVLDALLDSRLAAGLSAKTSFDVGRGPYVIRLVVRDSEGQLMSARNTMVEIP